MTKKRAFTLTELMIAVGIIGVISAMTVPSLVNNYQKSANAIQLRKVLNEITAAADMLTTEESKQHFDQTSAFRNIDSFFNQRFKVIKSCDSRDDGCFYGGAYKAIASTSASSLTLNNNHYLLANSAAIYPISITRAAGNHEASYIDLYIDINGPDSPNTGGRDMFYVRLNGEGEIVPPNNNSTCTNSNIGDGCYRRLLNDNWKMEY